MSTIYVFDDEVSEVSTPAQADRILLHDASAGLKKYATLSNVGANVLGSLAAANTWAAAQTFTAAATFNGNVALGNAATDTIGFYGATAVNQGTMTATAVTALATVTIEIATASSATAGFANSTVAKALALRVPQLQVDLDTLMARIDSTGLISITGL